MGKGKSSAIVVAVAVVLSAIGALGSSTLPLTPAQQTDMADAVCRGTVLELAAFRGDDGLIYTRAEVQVDETLKGELGKVIELVHRGGTIDDETQANDFTPRLRVGERRLLYLTRRADGTYFSTFGGAGAVLIGDIQPLAVTGTGLMEDDNGTPPRFLACDRDEPIPYVVDNEALPAGITLVQATNAVAEALQTWANVTSLKFRFDGLQVLGRAADTVTNEDSRLYIQLHDLYGAISPGKTLGIGGQTATSMTNVFPTGGLGGRVGALEFNRTRVGYLVLNHTNASMQVLSTFTEVLCHEIGHMVGMAHSSEDPSEPDPLRKQSIMYYQAHADGRGPTLGLYDPPVIQQSHPITNTPPYGYSRVIYAVNSSTPLSHPEVNYVEMKGYDRQGTALSRILTNSFGNGTFSFSGDFLTYWRGALVSNAPLDPASGSSYARTYVRLDDGTNASPYVFVRVIAGLPDTQPAGAPDGVPDGWMTTYFGSATPVAGVSGSDDDADGDGLTNIREFQVGTSPTQGTSTFAVVQFTTTNLQWNARGYDLYEIESSTNLTSYTRLGNPILFTTNSASLDLVLTNSPRQFLRIRKVP